MSTLMPGVSPSKVSSNPVQTLEIGRSEHIVAPTDIVWESLLEILGPGSTVGGDKVMPMVLEAWVGGRWFRDTGEGRGHLWGHVQVIKPGVLLEICGPLFMSYAAVSHVQYRLTAEGPTTKLAFKHTAFGLILPEHASGVDQGWTDELRKLRELAERKAKSR